MSVDSFMCTEILTPTTFQAAKGKAGVGEGTDGKGKGKKRATGAAEDTALVVKKGKHELHCYLITRYSNLTHPQRR